MIDEAALPDNPLQRRVIVALDDISFDRLAMEDSRDLTGRSDVAVVNADHAARHGSGLTGSLANRGLLRAGQVLVQSPFAIDDYETYASAADSFAMDKLTRTSILAGILGAKSLKLSSVEDETSKTRWDAQGGGAKGKAKLQAKGNLSQAESFAKKIRFEDKFAGSEPDLEAAQRHLTRWRLDGDRELLSLIEARSVPNNPLIGRSFSLDLSTESESRVQVAADVAGLSVLSGKLELGATKSAKAHYRVEYTITY